MKTKKRILPERYNIPSTAKIILFKGKKLTDGSFPILIRLNANRQRKHISTGLKCKSEHWNEDESRINDKFTTRGYNNQLSRESMDIKLREFRDQIKDIISKLGTYWTIEDFMDLYGNDKQDSGMSVLKYCDELVRRLRDSKRIGNAAVYAAIRRRFADFLNSKDISFNQLDASLVQKFKEFCESNGNNDSTVSLYLRTLRAIYKKAIRDKYAHAEKYPFLQITIPEGTPLKRAMSEDDFRKFKNKKLEDPELIRTRDYFLFSVYCRGINFIDMAELKVGSIKNNILTYKRKKTARAKRSKFFKIKILPQCKPIVDKYSRNKLDNEYLFPIINPKYTDPQSQYDRINKIRKRVNDNLRIIARLAEIDDNISTYTARHTFATLSLRRGASVRSIQEGLGHKDISVTETYLKSFEDSELDDIYKNALKGL